MVCYVPFSTRAVYEKIKDEVEKDVWKADGEEFEDSLGNVISKKMYEDLKRQGLL